MSLVYFEQQAASNFGISNLFERNYNNTLVRSRFHAQCRLGLKTVGLWSKDAGSRFRSRAHMTEHVSELVKAILAR